MWRVERGRVAFTQTFKASACSAFIRPELPPTSNAVRPSIPLCSNTPCQPDFTNWRVLARRSLWNRSGASPKGGTTGSERSGDRAEGRGRGFWRGVGGGGELQALQQE